MQFCLLFHQTKYEQTKRTHQLGASLFFLSIEYMLLLAKLLKSLLNCVDNGNKRHHFRAGQKAINAVLCLTTKVFDGVCVEARDGLTAKIANCVGGNCKQSATAKILDALAIECAKCSASNIRQAVAIYDVLGHAGAVLLDATAFDS